MEETKNKHRALEVLLVVLILILLLLFGYWGVHTYIEYRLDQQQNDYESGQEFNPTPDEDKKEDEPSNDPNDNNGESQTPDDNLGTSGGGNNGGGSSSSGGNNGGGSNSGSGNNGGGSNSGGGNNGGGSTPPEVPVIPTLTTFSLGDFEQNTVKISQSKNQIDLTGSMNEKLPLKDQGIYSGYYVQFRITAPRAFTEAELAKMYITLPYSGNTYTQAKHNVIDGKDSEGRAYFYLTQEFTNGKVISLQIDWGDGNKMNYYINFNIETVPTTSSTGTI